MPALNKGGMMFFKYEVIYYKYGKEVTEKLKRECDIDEDMDHVGYVNKMCGEMGHIYFKMEREDGTFLDGAMCR